MFDREEIMTAIDIVLLLLGLVVVLPIVAYMVAKMARAGYLRAGQRNKKQKDDEKYE